MSRKSVSPWSTINIGPEFLLKDAPFVSDTGAKKEKDTLCGLRLSVVRKPYSWVITFTE
jgi:hypothetical protein